MGKDYDAAKCLKLEIEFKLSLWRRKKNCITLFKESGFHILTVDRFVVSDLTGKSHRFITYVGLTRLSKNVAMQIFILMVQPIF